MQSGSVVLPGYLPLRHVAVLLAMCSSAVIQAQEIMPVNQALVLSRDSTLISVDAKGSESRLEAKTVSSADIGGVSASIGPGGKMEVSGGTSAHLVISEAVTAHLEPGTQIEVPQQVKDRKPTTSLKLLKGKMFITVDAAKLKKDGNTEFRLETPKSLLAVKGTRFVAAAGEQEDTVALIDGSLAVRDHVTKEFVKLRPRKSASVTGQGKLEIRQLTAEESKYSAVFDKSELSLLPYEIYPRSITSSAWFLPMGKSRKPFVNNWIEQPEIFRVKTMKFEGFRDKGIRADYASGAEAHQDIKLRLTFRSQPHGIFPDNSIGVLVKARISEPIKPFMTFEIFTETKTLLEEGELTMGDPLASPETWQSCFFYTREVPGQGRRAYENYNPMKMEIDTPSWAKIKKWPERFTVEIASIHIITLGSEEK